MTTQDILTQLTTPNEELPLAALEAAMINPQPLIPELLSLLQAATVNPDYLIENEFYRGHIYALYLLAGFREPRAYPLMIDFFSIPGDRFMDIAEDIVDEAGPFLASVCQGDDHLIKSLLENEQANEYARSEAAQALVILVACGSLSRDELVTYFQSLFRGKLQRQPNALWNNLVELAIDLYPEELYSDIRRAYAEDLVQPPVVPLQHLDTRLTLDKQRVLNRLPRKYRQIDNPVAELTNRFGVTPAERQKYVSDVVLNLTSNLGYFPRDSVQQAIAQRDLTKQMLMIFLQHAVERTFAVEEGDFTGHLYALYLLAQFREKEAYPWIVDLFSIPGEVSLNITGDVVTEDLHRILASVYDGDDSLLKGLVEDPKVNEYVRSAALQTFLVLVTTGQQSRETVMAYYQSLFHGKLERDQPFLWGSLIDCCTNLYPQEVYTDIQTAFAEDLVEEFFIDMDFVQKTYAQGQEAVLKQLHQNPYYTLIEDTIEDMEKWHWGTSSTKTESSPPPSSAKLKKPSEPRLSTVRTGPKIGRNDPCPCGSGKKYKKCCGK